jgi:hypothetical protein
MHKNFVCLSCEAEFKIKHDLDDHLYVVKHCCFCGDQLEDEESYDFDDEEE